VGLAIYTQPFEPVSYRLINSLGLSKCHSSPTPFFCYEVGRLRIAIATLVPLAEILNRTVDELLNGREATKINGKRGPASKLEKQMEQVQLLPRTKQQFVLEILDTVIQQAAH